ncbi:MAG TPA: hypothetical protein VJ552_05465 [Sediminibacterium sp.]|nr:hypothetical protein [Sediminibacterium sp.]
MEKKQTSVQWLEQKIKEQGTKHFFSLRELINKAIQMEREQIEEAYNEGYCHGVDVGCGRRPESKNGEQYYTQIF